MEIRRNESFEMPRNQVQMDRNFCLRAIWKLGQQEKSVQALVMINESKIGKIWIGNVKIR